jgi:phospholipid/cholesterol/gamma-HCH transport system substrate-binding protein
MKNDFTATEIRAGTLVLISLVILVAFVAAIRGCRPPDRTAKQYNATFANIGGLNNRADVRFGGVKVGRVVAIEPDPDNRAEIRVTVEVAGDVPINRGSLASIEQITLTAEKHLEISTGDPSAELHESGDKITSRPSAGLLDLPDLEGVALRLESLLDSVTVMFGGTPVGEGVVHGGEDIVDLAELSAALEATLNESTGAVREVNTLIAENRQGIDDIVTKLAKLEEVATELLTQLNAAVSENRQPLNATVQNLQQLTEQASTSLEELASSLSATLRYLQDAGGNASDLIDDQRPTIEEILINLQETTRNLKVLSQTLADQPNALIRGTKPHGRKDEEK